MFGLVSESVWRKTRRCPIHQKGNRVAYRIVLVYTRVSFIGFIPKNSSRLKMSSQSVERRKFRFCKTPETEDANVRSQINTSFPFICRSSEQQYHSVCLQVAIKTQPSSLIPRESSFSVEPERFDQTTDQAVFRMWRISLFSSRHELDNWHDRMKSPSL